MKIPKPGVSWGLVNGSLLVLFLVFLEGLLQVASPWLPDVDRVTALPKATIRPVISVPRIGHQGNPNFPGHDQWGFRNQLKPAQAAIIAMADSNTYGTSVRREDAWPHILSTYLDKPVYNMGVGGYGPAHNLMIINSALALHPNLILYMFYFGNDFADSFMITQKNKELDRFVSSDRSRSIALLEREHSLRSEVTTLFRRGKRRTNTSGFRNWLSENSRVTVWQGHGNIS